jgi:hypothetical protein
LISVNYGDYVRPPLAYDPSLSPRDLILTFENLLTRTRFVPLMKAILQTLAARFGHQVDIEFTADILPGYPQPEFRIHLLQCRPQTGREMGERIEVPTVSQADTLFTADRLVPHGRAGRIHYIVFVDPEAYARIPDETTRLQAARVVGQLNQKLKQKTFVLMGPGRWGSANLDLGVKVTYTDIYNTAVLIEIGLSDGGSTPEVSYGTHFFQNLVESEIYPLALFPGRGEAFFNWRFFRESANVLERLLPDCAPYAEFVRVIDVPAVTGGRLLEVVMDSEKSQAIGYLQDCAEESRV